MKQAIQKAIRWMWGDRVEISEFMFSIYTLGMLIMGIIIGKSN